MHFAVKVKLEPNVSSLLHQDKEVKKAWGWRITSLTPLKPLTYFSQPRLNPIISWTQEEYWANRAKIAVLHFGGCWGGPHPTITKWNVFDSDIKQQQKLLMAQLKPLSACWAKIFPTSRKPHFMYWRLINYKAHSARFGCKSLRLECCFRHSISWCP